MNLPINNTKHITIANMYIPPLDSTCTHYKTAETYIQHCIQYITNIPHSVLTGDVDAHSTLWLSYIDDHRGQLKADVIRNSDHITISTTTPTRVSTYYNKTDGLSPTIKKLTGNNSRKTQSPLWLRPPYPPKYTLPTQSLQTSYWL